MRPLKTNKQIKDCNVLPGLNLNSSLSKDIDCAMLTHHIHHNNGILTVRVPVSIGEKKAKPPFTIFLTKKLSTRLNFRQGVTRETGIGTFSHGNDPAGIYRLRSWLSTGMLI